MTEEEAVKRIRDYCDKLARNDAGGSFIVALDMAATAIGRQEEARAEGRREAFEIAAALVRGDPRSAEEQLDLASHLQSLASKGGGK